MDFKKISRDAPINEIVGFLYSFDENQLSKLRGQFPEYGEILKPGITLGENESIDHLMELKVRATVCKTGLHLVLEKSEVLLPRIKRRLKLLSNVHFISQIVVAISGASILIFLQEEYDEIVKQTIGFLTLFAALLTLFVQHRSGTIAFGENSLSKVFTDLTDSKLNAEHFLQELIIIEKLNFSSSTDQVSEIILKSNEICSQIRKMILKY